MKIRLGLFKKNPLTLMKHNNDLVNVEGKEDAVFSAFSFLF